MQADIEKVLISRDQIAARLDELASQIASDFAAEAGGAAEITLVPILTGSIIFVADLMRRLPNRMQIHVMSISSYPGASTSSRGATVETALTRIPEDLTGRHVLLIDDILDSGNTLKTAIEMLHQRNPASVRSCVLLQKKIASQAVAAADYVAFDIPDEFVVGYGLDFNDYYRNLPEIVTLNPQTFS